MFQGEDSNMSRLPVAVVTVAIAGGGLACLMSIGPRALWAQSNPLSAEVKRDYRGVRDYFIRAAEKMPEADYGFRPSPDVRTFGQQVAHVADDQYNLCAPAKGEVRKAAYTEIEDTLSKKADLVPALKQAFAYCDGAYDALTDASGAEAVKSGKMRSKFGMLNWNLWHTWEHYGNVVVYLRMKGLVPPSSEKMQMK
ncbi:MAG: DinB family protein [Acidobacteriia bacterium]|nr:DinB family protein [Terriglobia bacterium]